MHSVTYNQDMVSPTLSAGWTELREFYGHTGNHKSFFLLTIFKSTFEPKACPKWHSLYHQVPNSVTFKVLLTEYKDVSSTMYSFMKAARFMHLNLEETTKCKIVYNHHRKTAVATYPSAGGRRVTRGMRVPRKEYARSRHQRLFEENVGKTGKDEIYELLRGWLLSFFPSSPIYSKIGEVVAAQLAQASSARPGEQGCFLQKQPPSGGIFWRAQMGLGAICTPIFTKYTPLCCFLIAKEWVRITIRYLRVSWVQNDQTWSLLVIGPAACVRMQRSDNHKGANDQTCLGHGHSPVIEWQRGAITVRMTKLGLCLSSGPPPLDDKRVRITIRYLRSPVESPTVATYPSAGGRRVTRGMRVPRKEYARSRHQRLFEENVGKTGKDEIYELLREVVAAQLAQASSARPGEQGCFLQKQPPSGGIFWRAQMGLGAICTPIFTKYTPLCCFLMLGNSRGVNLLGVYSPQFSNNWGIRVASPVRGVAMQVSQVPRACGF
ncbi:hypothetical protein HKD37_04G010091 [Glycine soja]